MASIRDDFSVQAVGQGLLVALVGYASSVAVLIQGLVAVGATVAQVASALIVIGILKGIVATALSWSLRMPISIAWTTPAWRCSRRSARSRADSPPRWRPSSQSAR